MFHIIMPVYRTEEYLKEAIDSIIGQTLDFKENIVLHLVNDASPDHSAEICEAYQKQYPENIIYTEFTKNKGVSAARNAALRQCRGEKDAIVGFVDSDDILDKSALQKVKVYFENHPDIRMATMRIDFFEGKTGEHRLNYRFGEKDIVDIEKDYNSPQFYVNVFLRGKALKRLHFKEGMKSWEDTLALNKVIIREGKYGLVEDAVYYYRKREDASSRVDEAWLKKERYLLLPKQGYQALMNYCRLRKGKVIPYVQYMVAYHLRLYFTKSRSDALIETLTEEEFAKFKLLLKKILKNIDSKIIVQIPTSVPVIEMMLSTKLDTKIKLERTFTEDDCIFSYEGYEVTRMSERKVRLFHILDKEGYEGMWWGRFSTPVYAMKEEDYIFAVNDAGERIDSIRHPCKKKEYCMGKVVRNYKYAGFAIAIPPEWKKARFGIHMNERDILLNEVVFAEIEQQ